MKTEDIDKRIGMPDVDKEWARFEQEVIAGETKRRPALAWALGIGIAASVALLLIYNIGKTQKDEPLVAQVQPAQPEHVSEPARVPAKEVVAEVSKPVATPRKELTLAKADASADLGSGTTMRLRGIGESKPDSFLVVVNGKTLFDSHGMTSEEIDRRIEEYLNERGLLQDIKIP